MARALIIDDEPPACEALRALLAAHPVVTVVGEAGTLGEARRALARADYDLVFLDIQLRGGTGFDLVPEVQPGARIIFVTAYDQHALRAFEVNALDYLLKPVAPGRLAQALARLHGPERPPPAPTSRPVLTLSDRVYVRLSAANERFITLGDIRFIASCENYTEVHLGDGARLLVRRPLKQWEETLPPAHFVRAHRHLLVNLAHLQRLERATVATYHLHLQGLAEPLRASFRYIGDLRAALQARGHAER